MRIVCHSTYQIKERAEKEQEKETKTKLTQEIAEERRRRMEEEGESKRSIAEKERCAYASVLNFEGLHI